MSDFRIALNGEAAGVEPEEVVRLTERATASTFYIDTLTPQQIEANRRIPFLARQVFFEAATSENQHLAAAFAGHRLAGFMIATRHAADDRELDWLMVDPDQHGSGLAAALLKEGLDWFGEAQPTWLTVIKHNDRAIRFYRKFGFEIDPDVDLGRTVPTWIMRRPAPSL